MRWVVIALLAGCSFEPGKLPGTLDSGGSVPDAGTLDDAAPDPEDAPAPCTPGYLDVCGQPAPSMTIDIAGEDTIDTDTDPRCIALQQASGGEVCLVYASSVAIRATGKLIATGSRPLAIVSTSTLEVHGVIDVSSRRVGQRGPAASDASCTFSRTPDNDLGGAGGGAGGSFGGMGGDGGTGDTDTSLGFDGPGTSGLAGPVATFTHLRGGCRGQTGGHESASGGQGGAGGHSGGALYLYAAQRISIAGAILASGAGGSGGQVQAGGGGGGSGGLVVIETAQLSIDGQISANGGGGGEGGARVGSTPVSGQPGSDGGLGTTPAPGGRGNDDRFGAGGTGGTGTMAAGAGGNSIGAGGGGGGGVGIIKLIAPAASTQISGTISPPPT